MTPSCSVLNSIALETNYTKKQEEYIGLGFSIAPHANRPCRGSFSSLTPLHDFATLASNKTLENNSTRGEA